MRQKKGQFPHQASVTRQSRCLNEENLLFFFRLCFSARRRVIRETPRTTRIEDAPLVRKHNGLACGANGSLRSRKESGNCPQVKTRTKVEPYSIPSPVQIGSHVFIFDHVYSGTSSSSYRIFEDCISPLVDAFFSGDKATVLAYGRTGSGKTYSMGTNYNAESNSIGIIPKVMESIFSKVEETKDNSEFLIRVSFIEIFNEEVFDLLEGISSTKSSLPHRAPIQIRETTNGGISLHGVSEPEVRSQEEMTSFLSHGSISRATGSTNMNAQSRGDLRPDPRFDAVNVIALVIQEDDNDILDSFVLLHGDVAESCKRDYDQQASET
ncbi:hypothetical protein Syun_001402 [Stephania yunnanensis]|uniref:Kinesin motor domain-containing protein n=1 Tax=Stephania yunnanensis TaxID=152371 RepID=A0AAP0LFJ5_9MAGN